MNNVAVIKSIVTTEVYHQHMTADILIAVRRQAARRGVLWVGDIPIDDKTRSLRPRVNHGRWIVDCPYCIGAELMNESGLFMCQSCYNSGNGHRYLRVARPRGRAKVEALLLKRPLLENRNWQHGEAIALLEQENKEYGVN